MTKFAQLQFELNIALLCSLKELQAIAVFLNSTQIPRRSEK
jgi:hypothetical protein